MRPRNCDIGQIVLPRLCNIRFSVRVRPPDDAEATSLKPIRPTASDVF